MNIEPNGSIRINDTWYKVLSGLDFSILIKGKELGEIHQIPKFLIRPEDYRPPQASQTPVIYTYNGEKAEFFDLEYGSKVLVSAGENTEPNVILFANLQLGQKFIKIQWPST